MESNHRPSGHEPDTLTAAPKCFNFSNFTIYNEEGLNLWLQFFCYLLLEIKSMTGVGFEPTKLTHCRLKATPLTAREPSLILFFLFKLNI